MAHNNAIEYMMNGGESVEVFDFGDNLRRLREDLNLTQTQVAQRIGITKTMISAYEANTKAPKYDNLVRLASLYNTTTDSLLGIKHEFIVDMKGLTQDQQTYIKNLVISLCDQLNRANQNNN